MKTNFLRLLSVSALTCFGLCIASLPAAMGLVVSDITWTGGAKNGTFTDPANWENSNPPTNNGSAAMHLHSTSYPAANYINWDSDFSLFGITFDYVKRDYFFTSETGRTLTLGAGGIDITNTDYEWNYHVVFDHNLNLNLAAPQEWSFADGSEVYVGGNLSGSANLTKSGSGKLILEGNNSAFSGGITLLGGELIINQSQALGTGTLTFGSTAGYHSLNIYSHSGDPITIGNNLVMQSGLTLYTGRKDVHFSGNVTLNAPTPNNTVQMGLVGSTIFLDGVIKDAADTPGQRLVVSTSRAVILSGANTYTGGTHAEYGAVIFNSAAAIPAQGPLSASYSGYIGLATVPSDINASYLNRFNKPSMYGVIGFDTAPEASVPNNFAQDIDLSGFTNSTVSLGSATRAILSGVITPRGNTYSFGGGGGSLTINSALNDASGPTARALSLYSSEQAPMTLWLNNPLYTGPTSVSNSAVIFGQLPLTSYIDVASGSYAGISNDSVTPAQFLAKFGSTGPRGGIIGFDSNPSASATRSGSANNINLETAFPGLSQDPAIYLGTATAMTFSTDVALTLPTAATAYRFAGYKGGQLRVGSALTGAHDVIIGDGESIATFINPNQRNGPPSSVELFGNNTYTGRTILQGGRLVIGAKPSTTSTPAIGSGDIYIPHSDAIYDEFYEYNYFAEGDIWNQYIAMQRIEVSASDMVISNNIEIDSTLSVGGTRSFTLSGDIGGEGAIYVNGNVPNQHFSLTLSGNNSIDGGIYINNSDVFFSSNTAAGYSGLSFSPTTTTAKATFMSSAPIIYGLMSADDLSQIALNTGTSLTIDIRAEDYNSNDFYGTIFGAGSIVKANDGELLFGNPNSTYSGGTTISEGLLAIDASSTQSGVNVLRGPLGTGAVNVSADAALGLAPGVVLHNVVTLAAGSNTSVGGALAGYGTYAPLSASLTVANFAALSPGQKDLMRFHSNQEAGLMEESSDLSDEEDKNLVGALTLGLPEASIALTLGGNGIYSWAIQNLFGGPGQGWDVIHVNGNASFTATSTNRFTINVATLDGSDTLDGLLANFNAYAPYSWLIMDAASISGLTDFTNIQIDLDDFENPLNGGVFALSLGTTGDGKAGLYLNFTPVPEPSTYALMALGVGIVAWNLHRRRRRN